MFSTQYIFIQSQRNNTNFTSVHLFQTISIDKQISQTTKMINESQLSNLILDHIYLFRNEIQANLNHVLFHQKNPPNLINNTFHQISHPDLSQQHQQKLDLKVDLWKVNQNINKCNHGEQYVGPILSFQRRQIWSKNPSPNHHDHNKTIKERSNSISKPYQNVIYQQNDTNFLANTVFNRSKNQQNSIITSHQTSTHKNPHTSFVNKNNDEELRSTVKPYSVDQSKFKETNTNKQLIDDSLKLRLNKLLIYDSHSNSQIKRRHKIFSLASKPSQMDQESQNYNNQDNLRNKNADILKKNPMENKISNLPQDPRSYSPKNFNHPKVNRNFAGEHESVLIEEHQNHDFEQQLANQHVKFQILSQNAKSHEESIMKNQQRESKLSIIDHFSTIPHTQPVPKSTPSSQLNTITQTDYVPSPSQLNKILKTIEKQSRDTRQSRWEMNTRKSLYHKRLNNSIRYHQKNFQQPLQISEKSQLIDKEFKISREPYHQRQEFVPLHPNFFEPNQTLYEHPAKLKFSYLDPKSSQNEF